MLADLDPKPDQVTVTVNTSQMNVIEQMDAADIAGTVARRARELPRLHRDDRAVDAELLRGARATPDARPASRARSSSTTSTATRPSSGLIRRGVYRARW
jgi:hypothetical protein